MIKPMTSPPREKTMMIMPSMLENNALFTSTNRVVMATEPIINKRMIRNVQHQYLSNFGKWNYYALDGSRDKNSNPVTTKECTSATCTR